MVLWEEPLWAGSCSGDQQGPADLGVPNHLWVLGWSISREEADAFRPLWASLSKDALGRLLKGTVWSEWDCFWLHRCTKNCSSIADVAFILEGRFCVWDEHLNKQRGYLGPFAVITYNLCLWVAPRIMCKVGCRKASKQVKVCMTEVGFWASYSRAKVSRPNQPNMWDLGKNNCCILFWSFLEEILSECRMWEVPDWESLKPRTGDGTWL